MAVGERFGGFEWGLTPGLTSSWTGEHPIHQEMYGAVDSVGMRDGGVDRSAQPIQEQGRRKSGARMASYFDDYYNRIYLLPPSVNFGAVTGTTERSVRVWNAYLTPVTLTSITTANTTGLNLAGPSLPETFAGLEFNTYRVIASTNGPAYIDGRYTFTFSGVPVASVLAVFGSRAELWDLAPNWRERYDITHEYLTDIFTTRSGKEQRRALRTSPRKKLAFVALATGDKLRRFERLMAAWLKNTFIVPDMTRNVVTTTPLDAGTQQVDLDAVPAWIKVGGSVILMQGDKTEARLVETISGNSVTFTSIAESPWMPGARVHAVLSGRMGQDMRATRPTDDAAQIQVRFNVTPASEDEPALPAATTTWRGAEVFLTKPNYITPITIIPTYPVEDVDYNRGVTKTFTPINFGTKTWQAEYLAATRAQADALLNTFRRAKGRRGAFYMPTWKDDLPPMDPITVGSFRIRTKGRDTAKLMSGDSVHRNVAVFGTDGTTVMFNHVQQIIEIEDERGNDTILVLSNAWVQPLRVDQILRICWMPLWRFASDQLTISWVTDTVARITPTFVSLEDTP
ncbi:hypothetical protein D3C87_855510 [compost metagenome]